MKHLRAPLSARAELDVSCPSLTGRHSAAELGIALRLGPAALWFTLAPSEELINLNNSRAASSASSGEPSNMSRTEAGMGVGRRCMYAETFGGPVE